MPLIPEHIWAQLTPEEQTLIRETIRGHRAKGKLVACPSCGADIHISARVEIMAVDPAKEEQKKQAFDPLVAAGLSNDERHIIEIARGNGMLAAFEQAVREQKSLTGIPASMELFFLQFWQIATPYVVPRTHLMFWREEFGGYIEAWQHQGILAITADGVVRAFVPLGLLKTRKLAGVTLDTTPQWEGWKKGRFGYVPAGSSAFNEALAQANIGKFGRIVQ